MKSNLKIVLDCLIAFTIFFWLLVYCFSFPNPINWFMFGNITLALLIFKRVKENKNA